MAYNSVRPRQPYNYETPEQRAREQLRAQKTIAGVTTRANEQAQSVAALQALAKATGVPDKELPAGGIHNGMSPADVQAATDRINRWVGVQPKPQGAQGPAGPNAGASTAVAGALGLPASPVAQSAPTAQTRTTPTGGTETLVQSESGPRWVASVNNAPPINNQNGQVSRDPGGQTRQVQMNPIAGGPAPTVAQNQQFYANPTGPMVKPWTPPDQPATVTSPTDAARIAFQYGDKTGGFVTNGPSALGTPGYAETGAGAPPYVPPAVTARVAQDIATSPKPVAPITGNAVPGLPPNAGVPPTGSQNPVTSPSRAGAIGQPFNPDDEEERKRRMAASTPPASPAPTSAPTPQPYQY